MESNQKYETVIGLEVHVQLSTKSKAFCGDEVAFAGKPNSRVSPISLAHPGTLPKMNKTQLHAGIKLGLALGSKINRHNRFDRKNYFYADLPKGYQITQDAEPICIGGLLPIKMKEGWKNIRIHHVHMEEDAGKSIHDQHPDYSLIDLNRAGVPLLELVSEPDLRSADEVDAFMTAMRRLVRYLGISDADMEKGQLRCDCNISIRPVGNEKLGQRCEVKNLNSMKYARQAIKFEVQRQIEIVEAGGSISQQTLHFDPATGETSPLRDKENAHDYRYFPEPDLPPIEVGEELLNSLEAEMPVLPNELYEQFTTKMGLSDYDASILMEEKRLSDYFLALAKASKDPKEASKLIINKINPWCKEENVDIEQFPIKMKGLAAFIHLIKSGKVSQSIAWQNLFPELIISPEMDPEKMAESMNLIQNQDEDFIKGLAQQIIEKNPDKVKAYQKGKKGLLGFFVGQLMRESKGAADPKMANELLREMLEE